MAPICPHPLRTWIAAVLVAGVSSVTGAQTQAVSNTVNRQADVTSESDYLSDIPTVMSVSRIAQTLDDTPGAMTIIDREFIRLSGARDVVSLLALVPGFQSTTSVETDAPMATYHGRTDDWANRIQVLVDGRSVYSGFLQGSAGIGWKSLALDDIDHIEVLRGSNSATYGARAFLGVVNIVSRDVRETTGVAGSVSNGANGIDDRGARLGWRSGDASYRVSVSSEGDDGLRGAFGRSYTERANVAAHFALAPESDLDVRVGSVGMYAGRGTVGDFTGNPARMWFVGNQFVQADWHLVQDEANDLSVGYSHTENRNRDNFRYARNDPSNPYYMAVVDFSGDEIIDTLTLQRSTRQSATLRTVVGLELRQENDISASQFDGFGGVTNTFSRVFASAEWRLGDALLLNAGALAEHDGLGGDSISPRAMLNWHLAPGNTLRMGGSTAFRPPSAYEKYAQLRYYDVNGANPTRYYVLNDGTLQSEKLVSTELGYYYAPPTSHMNADVRIFNERIINGIAHTDSQDVNPTPQVYVNAENYQINGLEWQLNWQPSANNRVFFSQTWTHIVVDSSLDGEVLFRTAHSAPSYASSLMLAHLFDSGWQVSASYQSADNVALNSISNSPLLASSQRTDLRVARPFHIGKTKVEAALVCQNLNVPYQDGDWKFRFEQRTMLTLKFEQ